MSTVLRDERLLDLLVKQATEGVSGAEKAEIDSLLARHADADPQMIERVVSALSLVGISEEPLPAALRDRIVREGEAFVNAAAGRAPTDEMTARRVRRTEGRTGGQRFASFALAATVLLAVVGWWPRLQQLRGGDETPDAPLTAAEKCAQVFAAAPAGVQADWGPAGDPASTDVKGTIVFDPQSQAGCMRFTGLAANDPGQFQYQLWIFDAKQDERYPIDGGVFDIPAGQTEVVVPIDPKISVREPVMFAVTMEKPGGVVVSAREHIVALAKAAPG